LYARSASQQPNRRRTRTSLREMEELIKEPSKNMLFDILY
jgi:hypothetical protein